MGQSVSGPSRELEKMHDDENACMSPWITHTLVTWITLRSAMAVVSLASETETTEAADYLSDVGVVIACMAHMHTHTRSMDPSPRNSPSLGRTSLKSS